MQNIPDSLRRQLDDAADRFNTAAFIEGDPISVPHRYALLQDREIAAFWAATIAWGQRKTIIDNALKLMRLMDDAPHDFIVNHQEKDRERFMAFRHRTFQPDDTLYFLEWLQMWYRSNESLESAFARHLSPGDETVEKALIGFHQTFFDHPMALDRTRKHIATPQRGSTCKRLNMFLRWMVRTDNRGVDLGVWKNIRPNQLLIPLDVHVDRVARQLGLLTRKQTDWAAVLELSAALRRLDPADPARYDFALFGWGVLQKSLLK